MTDAGMSFLQCPTCGVLRIPQENLVHYTVLPDPVGEISILMRSLFNLRMWWLRREFPVLRQTTARIVDIGCGDGQFLQYLVQKGYRNAFGIEPDEVRAANARLRGIPVFPSKQAAEQAGHYKDGVDLMFIWHVLEHVDRPADFLRDYVAWLVPGGQMIISVPNQKSLQTMLFGFYSAYPDYGRHIWYHDKSYLAWVTENVPNVTTSLVQDHNFEYEVFSWVDSLGSSIFREQNFVHRALKKKHGNLVKRFTAAAVACLLLLPSGVLSLVSLFRHRGSTLTFQITKLRSA